MNSKQLAPDRFLQACPIRYDCRRLFVYLIEMEYIEERQTVETILQYPETRDQRCFKSDQHLKDFLDNVKKFAFPYKKTANSQPNKQSNSSQLVQFYPFVFTDEKRIRQYGYCRSAKSGNHILCLISYLPWYSVFIGLLNKIAQIINEKETDALYHFLEAVYEYELPESGSFAEIFSHDGLEHIKFWCPDRRVVPSINENRNLLKFFAFFDLEKIIKIFTALLLERHIIIVSKDLENMTACALSLEYLIYPLEWLYAFAPIMPEHIDPLMYHQPFPFIYGVHTTIYESLIQAQKDDAFILLVDERQIINGDRDKLPDNVVDYLHRKLKYFNENESMNNTDYNHNTSASSVRIKADKYGGLLHRGTIQAFLDSVLMVIDDYREYLKFDQATNQFQFDENAYFQLKNVENLNQKSRYSNQTNEFYHNFRTTQAFQEFCSDRSDYLKRELEFKATNSDMSYPKDFIETLCDQFRTDSTSFHQILNKGKKIFRLAKEKLLNSATPTNNTTTSKISVPIPLIQLNKAIEEETDSFKQKTEDDETTSSKYERSLSSASSASSSSSSASSALHPTNDEKIKETIRRFANATQASLTRIEDLNESTTNRKVSFNEAYSRLTIDLSNDPDIKKYFETQQTKETTEPVKEEKLIDFSDYQPNNITNSIQISSSSSVPIISNKNSFQFQTSISSDAMLSSNVLNPSRVEKKDTYETILNEFDPIKNSETNQKPQFNMNNFVPRPYVANQAQLVNRPNYNVSLPLAGVTNTMSFHTNSFYPTNTNQFNLSNQGNNSSVSETIARFNAINRSNASTTMSSSAEIIRAQDFNAMRNSFSNPSSFMKK